MTKNLDLLKEKMGFGKQLGMSTKRIQDQMKHLTNKIEEIRRENAMRGLVDASGNIMQSEDEEALQGELRPLRQQYDSNYKELKNLKADIMRIKQMVDHSKKQLHADFKSWY